MISKDLRLLRQATPIGVGVRVDSKPRIEGRFAGMNRRIVSLGRTLPYVGINHAGGEYVRRHLRALDSLGFEITLVVPDGAQNELHRASVDPPLSRLVLVLQSERGNQSLRRLVYRFRQIFPLAPPIGFATACFL